MPRYVIERQYLVPIFEHIFVEAPDLEKACQEALDEFTQPWGNDAKLDYDSAQATTVVRVVEMPDHLFPELRSAEDADCQILSQVLYDIGLCALPIAREFIERDRKNDNLIGFF